MNYINSFNNRPKLYKSKIKKTISNPNITSPNKRLINKEYIINNNAKNIHNKSEIKYYMPKPKTFRLNTNNLNY